MLKTPTLMLIAATTVLAGAAIGAEVDQSRPLENVKVIPADTPRSEVTELMKHFTRSLGVRCSYCHVGEEGAPLSTYDFASDAKRNKRTARFMMRMTYDLNDRHFGDEISASKTDMRANAVTCYTCHRGSTEPLTERPAS